MGKYPYHITMAISAALAALYLAACGAGSTSGTAVTSTASVSTAQAATDLSGISDSGSPLSGTIYLSDATFPSKYVSETINPDGTYSFSASELSGLQPPYLLKSVDSAGNAWYSIAAGTGTANVNPLTTLEVAIASGSADLESLSQLFDAHNLATLKKITLSLAAVQSEVMTALKPLLTPYGADSADPLSGFYATNAQDLEGFLAGVAFTFTRGSLVLTDKQSQVPVFSAPLTDMANSTLNLAALSAPPVLYLPGNAVLTLALQGNLAPGTSIKLAAFSLQLPLGITVDTGNSDVNTAIPIGGAAESNIYPAPALSASNNQLNISLSSLRGISTGDFLAVRCTASTAALLATSAADFTITSAILYADIYRNQILHGLSIVPVSLVFPLQEGKTLYTNLCASCHNLSATDTSTATLYNKADQLAALFSSRHHGIALSETQVKYLSEYLSAISGGQVVF